MGILDETRYLERYQFFNGQRLFASDLQGLEAFHREMRWLHNISLHQPGIGNGFAIEGKKGDREVTINPGYAIDNQGREIVLTQPHVEPVPPVAGDAEGKPVYFDLTVSYPDDEALEEAETREGICLPRGVVRRQEQPLFCWVRLEKDLQGNLKADGKLGQDIKDGRKIILARLEILNCQLNARLSIAQRRSARPKEQPHIACGHADPTPWEIWNISQSVAMEAAPTLFIPPLGLKAVINTTQAKFVTTPCYSARIEGKRIIEVPDEDYYLIDGLLNVDDAKPNQFTVYVVLIVQKLSPSEARRGIRNLMTTISTLREARERESNPEQEFLELFSNWHIVWMGVEG